MKSLPLARAARLLGIAQTTARLIIKTYKEEERVFEKKEEKIKREKKEARMRKQEMKKEKQRLEKLARKQKRSRKPSPQVKRE